MLTFCEWYNIEQIQGIQRKSSIGILVWLLGFAKNSGENDEFGVLHASGYYLPAG